MRIIGLGIFLGILILSCNVRQQRNTKKELSIRLSINKTKAVSNTDLIVSAHFHNTTQDTISLAPLHIWESPILKLIVWDSQAKRVPTIPPAMPLHPDSPIQKKVLAPQEKYIIDYTLHIFSPTLPSGKYTVALQEGVSDTIAFQIE